MSNIHIQYCYSSEKKTLLDTEIVIPVDCWDKITLVITPDLPPQFGSAKRLNEALQAQMRLVENIISYAVKKNIENKGDFVKKYYSPGLDIYSLDELVKRDAEQKIAEEKAKVEAIRQDVFKQIDAFVASKEKKLCKDFPRLFKNLKDHLSAYGHRNTFGFIYEIKSARNEPLSMIPKFFLFITRFVKSQKGMLHLFGQLGFGLL